MEIFSKLQFYAKLGFATGLMLMRTRELRRKLMFFVSIGAMLSVFVGGVVIIDSLMEHPWLFVIYWLLSGTLVLGMLLLALYDILRLKADQAAHERSELMGMLEEIKEVAADEESDKSKTNDGNKTTN